MQEVASHSIPPFCGEKPIHDAKSGVDPCSSLGITPAVVFSVGLVYADPRPDRRRMLHRFAAEHRCSVAKHAEGATANFVATEVRHARKTAASTGGSGRRCRTVIAVRSRTQSWTGNSERQTCAGSSGFPAAETIGPRLFQRKPGRPARPGYGCRTGRWRTSPNGHSVETRTPLISHTRHSRYNQD